MHLMRMKIIKLIHQVFMEKRELVKEGKRSTNIPSLSLKPARRSRRGSFGVAWELSSTPPKERNVHRLPKTRQGWSTS